MDSSAAAGEDDPLSSTSVSEEGEDSCLPPAYPGSNQNLSWEENAEQLYGPCIPANSSIVAPPNVREASDVSLQQQQRDLTLSLSTVKLRTGRPDTRLQQYVGAQLRLLENDDRKARVVFSELSARLLSIHSEDHRIVVTFRTFEEIWKFVTYYSLGFLNPCMENLLLDDDFWLSSHEDEVAAGIEVHFDEECLGTIYRWLLTQEENYFVFHPGNIISEQRGAAEGGNSQPKGAATERERAPGPARKGDLAKEFPMPLNPFHQWSLKVDADAADLVGNIELTCTNQTATGASVAITSHESAVPEELGFEKGDRIEIIGFFMQCMPWFVGRHLSTGQVGFVRSSHAQPESCHPTLAELQCLDSFEDGHPFLTRGKACLEENVIELLEQTSSDKICNVYRIDGQEHFEFEKSAEKETSRSFLTPNSSILKSKVEHSLMKVQDLELHEEGLDAPKRLLTVLNGELPSEESQEPCFRIGQDDEGWSPETWDPLLSFLNHKGYEAGFKNLYDLSFSFLNTLFYGYTNEQEVVDYLGLAREAAKRTNSPRALTRLCYLLGRMSVRRSKLSQARVYFEEALAALQADFHDLYLVASLYANLTAIYLKQKNKEKCAFLFDKAASLLMGIPSYISSTSMESALLKYALKRAVLSQDKKAEARACFLLVRHCLNFRRDEEALPFLERLQLLNKELGAPTSSSSVNVYLQLGQLYSQKCLPHLVLSCVQVASSHHSCTLLQLFRSIDLVSRNSSKLHSLKPTGHMPPSQIARYLQKMLPTLEQSRHHPKLYSLVCCNLARLYSHHKRYGQAIGYMAKVLDTNRHTSNDEIVNHLIFLSWLYICHGQNAVGLDLLNAIVEYSWSSQQQLGVAYNMIAISFRRMNNIKLAAESYYKALHVSKETGMLHNQAVALANLGILCLHSAARSLGEYFLIKAVKLFSELPSVECDGNFIDVLLRLGHHYANGIDKEKGRCCYEWACLVAMETNHLEGQFQAVQHLCQFYSTVLPDEAHCVIYNEYRLSLARKMSDKVTEGQVLETISRLYLSLGTERAYRSALDYTKRSLGIFIDLQAKEREALAWLQAGKIYYILRQNELVDLYLQVAQNAALCTQDPNLEMELFEASGDIFFNGDWDKAKGLPFYRDKALPLAVKTGNSIAELRLCNKLVGLLLTLEAYEESLAYAQASLMLSVALGHQLNERIAYHRLAVIHHHLGQCELAEHFYLKALSLCSSPLEAEEEALYYVKVYLVLGDIIFYDLKDPFDAAGYYNLALGPAMDLGNKKAQLKIYTRLAIIYHNFLVDREMSLFFYQKARAFATELNIRRINLAPEQYYMRAKGMPLKNVR